MNTPIERTKIYLYSRPILVYCATRDESKRFNFSPDVEMATFLACNGERENPVHDQDQDPDHEFTLDFNTRPFDT